MNRKNIIHFFSYLCLRAFIYPFSLLPYKAIHRIGNALGPILYYLIPHYRKRTLSNLSLAADIPLREEELKCLAKRSFGSLATTCLEYGKMAREKNIAKLVHCENPEKASAILSEGKGLIFLCAHQANWELFFLEGSSRMPGVAIGQPVKNPYLYNWVLRIRQKYGGKIVLPKEAVKEGLRALKQGKFFGIVGDQGMPDAGFSSSFLGRNAWTSPLPAILAYRSHTAIITATMRRDEGRYIITYSDPIWPDLSKTLDQEIPRLMKAALEPMETSIKQKPEEWLWQHNRWKQQLPGRIRRSYRYDAIAVILPKSKKEWARLAQDIHTFKDLYPTELLVFFTPFSIKEYTNAEERLYKKEKEVKTQDYRFKLVFNLTRKKKLGTHFLKLSCMKLVTLKTLSCETKLPIDTPLITLLIKAIFCHAS